VLPRAVETLDSRGAKRRRIGNGSEHAYFLRKFNVEKMADCSSSSVHDVSAVNTAVEKFGAFWVNGLV